MKSLLLLVWGFIKLWIFLFGAFIKLFVFLIKAFKKLLVFLIGAIDEKLSSKKKVSKSTDSAYIALTDNTSAVLSDIEERLEREQARIDKINEEFDQQLKSLPRVEIQRHEPVKRRTLSEMPLLDFTNITRATNISKLFPLAVIDVETTGLKVTGDIVEASAIIFDEGFVPVKCFTTLTKPRKPIPAEAAAVNGITDEMVQDCPMFSEIADSFSEFISGCTIVGHNLRFDLKYLFVSGANFSQKVKYYDTLQLARFTIDKEDIDNYKLDTVCQYYGIFRGGGHRSLSDSLATAKIFEEIIRDKTD